MPPWRLLRISCDERPWIASDSLSSAIESVWERYLTDLWILLSSNVVPAPDVIVYDNACHLADYALNREPDWIRLSRLVIDRLHFANHVKQCSEGFDMRIYSKLANINSEVKWFYVYVQCVLCLTWEQVCEQMNSLLKLHARFTRQMTQEHFMIHMRNVLFERNISTLSAMQRKL